jgi:hypothetical protein
MFLPLQDEDGPSFDDSPPIIVIDSSLENLSQHSCKKKRKLYEGSKKFQDAWICLPFMD